MLGRVVVVLLFRNSATPFAKKRHVHHRSKDEAGAGTADGVIGYVISWDLGDESAAK